MTCKDELVELSTLTVEVLAMGCCPYYVQTLCQHHQNDHKDPTSNRYYHTLNLCCIAFRRLKRSSALLKMEMNPDAFLSTIRLKMDSSL